MLLLLQGSATLVKFARGRGVTEQRDPRFNLDEASFDLNLTSVRYNTFFLKNNLKNTLAEDKNRNTQ